MGLAEYDSKTHLCPERNGEPASRKARESSTEIMTSRENANTTVGIMFLLSGGRRKWIQLEAWQPVFIHIIPCTLLHYCVSFVVDSSFLLNLGPHTG